MLYQQCKLVNGNTQQVAWIPKKFALKGRQIAIQSNNDWQPGWVVAETWTVLDEKFVPDSHRQIRNHRRRTGDAARPKTKSKT